MSCPPKKPPQLAGRLLGGGEGRDAPENTEKRRGRGRDAPRKERRPRKKPESGRVGGGGEAAGRGNQGERKRNPRRKERKPGKKERNPKAGAIVGRGGDGDVVV